MPKAVTNNRIDIYNANSLINKLDRFVNQGVNDFDSPTFSNLQVTNNVVIEGSLSVLGNVSLIDTNVTQFKDNILLVNDSQGSPGVTLNLGGIQVYRGGVPDFQIVYNEANQELEAGFEGSLYPITIRDFNPLNNGIMIWNSTTQHVESRNYLDISIIQNDATNSTSSTSGSFYTYGGIGITKDAYINGTINLVGSSLANKSSIFTNPGTNSLTLISPQNILLTAAQNIVVPYSIPIYFGNSNNNISVNTSNNMTISNLGNIALVPATNKVVSVPNQIPIIFSTSNEKIYADGSNNMVITSSQDIQLTPSSGKKILVPTNIPLAFSNNLQSISADISNNLTMSANGQINLTPGSLLNVNIPTNNGIKFGGSGLQRLYADSSNNLFINGTTDINISAGNYVNIQGITPLTFYTYGNNINGDSSGNLFVNGLSQVITSTQFYFSNGNNSVNATTGSAYFSGGIGIKKNIIGEGSLIIQNASGTQFFNIDSSTNGKVNVNCGDGTSTNPSIEIINQTSNTNATSLLQLKAKFDTTGNYTIGRGNTSINTGRSLTVNLPSYTTYSSTGDTPKFMITSNDTNNDLFSVETDTGNIVALGAFQLSNTTDATSPTSAGLVLLGGLGVVKSIFTSGIYSGNVNSTRGFSINNAGNIEFNIDTINHITTINESVKINITNTSGFLISSTSGTNTLNIDTQNNIMSSSLQNIMTNTTNSIDTSSGSLITPGGLAVQKMLHVGSTGNFYGSINMQNTKITNLQNCTLPQDAATKAYVDLVKQGLYWKDAVQVATVSAGNFTTDFITGNTIDNYVLNLGDRILLKDQISSLQNGIYNVSNSGGPIRAIDATTGNRASGMAVFVQNGSMNAQTGWLCNSPSYADVIDTNNITFIQFTGLGQVDAGAGLSKIFNQINVNVDNSSIEIVSDTLRVKDTICGTGLTGGSGSAISVIPSQPQITTLGTIGTGVWQGSTIGVLYGGTGNAHFTTGNILFGNGTNPINTNTNLYYDSINTRFGLGTNSPSTLFNIQQNDTSGNAIILLNVDPTTNNTSGVSQLVFSYSNGINKSDIGIARSLNDSNYNTTGVNKDALVLTNLATNGSIQFATNQFVQMTIDTRGNVGIHTTIPNYSLSINGTLGVTGLSSFLNTVSSTSSSTASVILSGGLSINNNVNSSSVSNGGGLTIKGGAAISQDLYIGGLINCLGNGSSFAYMTITATDEAINLTTGSLITFGGITMKTSMNASSVTNGGSILTPGGAAIGSDFYLGGIAYISSGNMLINSLEILSNGSNNNLLTNGLPLNLSNDTTSNILTIIGNNGTNGNVIVNDSNRLKIGSYIMYYTSGSMNVLPITNNDSINIGTIGNYSNINIYGNNSGLVSFNQSLSELQFNNTGILLKNTNNTVNNLLFTINSSGTTFISNSGTTNGTLNIGGGSNATKQLTTILTNHQGTSTVTFTPNNTSSTLIASSNVTTTFNGPVNILNTNVLSGGALHQTITNTSGNSIWYYIGQISKYTEINFSEGLSDSQLLNSAGLKVIVSVNGTNGSVKHLHYGDLTYNSSSKIISNVYNNTSGNFHLFSLVPQNSVTNIDVVVSDTSIPFVITNEGSGSYPDGALSGYDNINWTDFYSTNIPSSLPYSFGNTTIEGSTFKINDPLPVIGYNNSNTTSTRDIGILYQRYQIDNDSGTGDIVGDTATFIDSLPNQSSATLSQIILSNLASSVNGYYDGWWVEIVTGSNINQVRQIINYVGGVQKVANLSSPLTTQNPSIGDTVNLYNNSFVTNYYDNSLNTFIMGYTSTDPGQGSIINNNDANLRINELSVTSNKVSTNASTGSVYLLGSIAINNTTNATNYIQGGTFTSIGGGSFAKTLIVGQNIGIGTGTFAPQEPLHILNNTSSGSNIRLEHSTGSYNYIDLVENSNNTRFGILQYNNLFSLTNTTSGNTPNLSDKVLTINSQGNIGINTTTNINSPFVLSNNEFISTDSSTGYLGLIGGNTNTDSNILASRIKLYGNGAGTGSIGNLGLYAGGTSGNLGLFTNNDTKQITINSNNTTTIYSTTLSSNSSTGSLILNGGLSINSTEQAISYTQGGAVTVAGGVSIKKDLWVQGTLHVSGLVVAGGSVTSPTISLVNLVNCTTSNYYNSSLVNTSSYGQYSVVIDVLPLSASQNTQFEFALPSRITNLATAFDVVANVNGLTDSVNLIPLFNVLGVGVTGGTNILIKFQSVSTNIHSLQIMCNYTII